MPTIAYQLYCSRNFPPLEKTFSMLRDAGYDAVEGYSAMYGDVAATRTALDEVGLSMPSAHFGIDLIEGDLDAALGIARTLGVKKVIVPYLMPDERPTGLAEWTAFATRLAELGKPVRDAGFAFGWHNHDFELADIGGVTPLDLIAQAGVDLELDLGWVRATGQAPLDWLVKYGEQTTCVHIKDVAPDGTCADEDGWADVGYGTIDWSPIKTELETHGIDHWVVEHDNPSDDARFATRSLATLKSWLGDAA
ncbi:MAG: sugar phosphate isomerase/epimerase [Pseudomonadota bacterium]